MCPLEVRAAQNVSQGHESQLGLVSCLPKLSKLTDKETSESHILSFILEKG